MAPSFRMADTYRAARLRKAVTAEVEKRVLRAIAARLPAWVGSDHLTALGVLGAIGVGAGYALSVRSPHWLWLASAMLVLNWLGDSLDGTLARVRGTERPRYGYYLDHGVDALSTTVIGAGIGLSPFVDLRAALALVVLYLILSINVYLESSVYGVFRMDYGVVGPTEVRIILVAVNALLVWLVLGAGLSAARLSFYGTLVIAGLAAAMLGLFLFRFVRNLRDLSRQEPLKRGKPRE
ncbi:MAG TPA: CDP-alcohol phosphatidyltransferase family protein [Longimicrobiales bacterium]|nr:CDP-alcohol phosphatidyltransferase family protein [Longimicrobiales bacterium]